MRNTRWEFLVMRSGVVLDCYEDVAIPVTLSVEEFTHKGEICKLVIAPNAREGWAKVQEVKREFCE